MSVKDNSVTMEGPTLFPPWIGSVLILIVFLGSWEGYVRLFDVSMLVLPPPSAVVVQWLKFLVDGNVWYHTGVTTLETGLGFLFASILGVGLGMLLGKMPRLERMLNPFVIATQVVPKVALVPLFIVWFGFGITSKVVIATILAFFPILLNTVLGVKSVERGHSEVMASINASPMQRLTQLDFPSSLPYILTGMEVGVVLSIIGAVVGEYLGGSVGLGNLAVREMNTYNTTALFAVIVHLSVLGFLFYAFVVGVRKYLIPWHGSSN